jgi:hypothetical protein
MFSSDAAAGTKGAHFVTDIVSAPVPGPGARGTNG